MKQVQEEMAQATMSGAMRSQLIQYKSISGEEG
jgi:hypothetical protein